MNIHSVTDEIREEKKKEEEQQQRNHRAKIYWSALFRRAAIKRYCKI